MKTCRRRVLCWWKRQIFRKKTSSHVNFLMKMTEQVLLMCKTSLCVSACVQLFSWPLRWEKMGLFLLNEKLIFWHKKWRTEREEGDRNRETERERESICIQSCTMSKLLKCSSFQLWNEKIIKWQKTEEWDISGRELKRERVKERYKAEDRSASGCV